MIRWRWRLWPWSRRHGAEAAAVLARLEQREPEVERLGAELADRQRANNFSGMVAAAIARNAGGSR